MDIAAMPSHPLGQFIRGLSYPIVAFFFIARHRLWRWALIPVLLQAMLLAGVCTWLWVSAWPLVQYVGAYFQTMASDADVMAALIDGMVILLWILVFPIALVLAGVVTMLVGQCVASPFLELLSERVEAQVNGVAVASPSWWRLGRIVSVALIDTVGGLLYLMVTSVPLFFLSFIPLVGTLASVGVGALLVAQQFVGLPQARALVGYGDRWRMVLRHHWFCLGFGTTAVGMLTVPGINLLLLPVAAVGGTLLYCDLRKAGLED